MLITRGISKTADDIAIVAHSYTRAAQDIAGHVDCLECSVKKQKIVNKPSTVREHTRDRTATVDSE